MEINTRYVNDIYDQYTEIDNEEKIASLDLISEYVTQNAESMGISKKKYVQKFFDHCIQLPVEVSDIIESLIESHYKMILMISNSVIRKYPTVVLSEDLIYYGIYGIYRGSLNYDKSRNEGDINVASYLWQWVETYTRRGASKIANPIHLPGLKVKKGTRVSVLPLSGPTVSDDEDGCSGHDILANEEDTVPIGHEFALYDDMVYLINKHLTPKEQYVIKSLYSIDSFKHKSIEEISDNMGVTKQMIYNHRNSALDKLKPFV